MGFFVCGDEDAAGGVFGFAAAVEAYPRALWYVLHDRQQPLKLRRLGDADVVAKGEDLVSFTLEGVAEPPSVDY